MPNKNRIMKVMLAIALLPLLLLSTQAFGQTASSISGAVTDTSQAVLPGSSITATNTETGITSKTVANNSGVYNFPSLQPGIYQVIVEMNGFQKATKTDVKLGMGNQVRLNFELVVAGVATEVEVTTSAENLMLEAGSSTGTVLQQDLVTELPLASNDVMDLISIMGGVVKSENPIFDNANSMFAGVAGGNVNIQRDGITVNEVRYTSGIVSPSRINQEMVGEFKLVLSPVDAEMGRGAGQVQILTKSGANAFHGSAVWNNQNTALDANEFYRNRTNTKPDWRNLNNYTLSVSGPIIKNKTFFFATWDQQIVRAKQVVTPKVMTNCAKMGIYRYLYEPGTTIKAWQNGNTQTAFTGSGNSRPTVNADGTPAYALTYKTAAGVEQTTPTAVMGFESVLGVLTTEARAAVVRDPVNCSDAFLATHNPGELVDSGSYWESYRNSFDTTGYITRFSAMMPEANFFAKGDGLNWAGHRWVRVLHGSDTVFGSGEDNERKSITTKIDHNINNAHRASGTYTYETDKGEDAYATWPNGLGGMVDRQPQSFTVSLTSTLKPTLLNEFRMGLSRTRTHTNEPLTAPKNGDRMAAALLELMPTQNFPNYSGNPLLVQAGGGNFQFGPEIGDPSHVYGSRGNLPSTWGGLDPRWSFSDTITWTRGAHSLKGGFDYRRAKSWQDANGFISFSGGANTFPFVRGGTLTTSPHETGAFQQSANAQTGWVGMFGTDTSTNGTGNYPDAYSLLDYQAGSIGNMSQYFYVNSAEDRVWNDPSKGELSQIVDVRNQEFAFFFKDDWKVSSSLTLNLGVRYEYYGVPYVASGMTAALVGGSSSLFGISGGDLSTWMPANPTQTGSLTEYQFVGPNSPNPGLSPFNKDQNNFAPHVGFAWQLPWFGKGKTTLRGGYSMSYSPITNFDGFANIIAKVPGTTFTYTFAGTGTTGEYLDLADLPNMLPLVPPSSIQPISIRPVTDRSVGITVYDENIRNPYVQSLNMSLTRNIGSNMTVDVRYIGTLGRKSISGLNLNNANFINNGLYDVLNRVRLGTETSTDLTFLGQIIGYNHTTNAGYLRAQNTNPADQLRNSGITAGALWQGNFNGVASSLSTTNGALGPKSGSGSNGNMLRWSCNDAGITGNCENLISTNPQYTGATINANRGKSNYHSLQAQVTMRPTRGLSFQSTYTWSRNLVDGNPNDFTTMERTYNLASQHRSHQLTSYGSFDMPLGANGFIFRNATGVFKKAIEGWQISWVASMSSGLPGSVSGLSRFWGDSRVDLVRPDLFDPKSGKVTWAKGAAAGYFYGANTYSRVVDTDYCATLHTTLRTACNASFTGYYALKDNATGAIVMRQAAPGTHGNFDFNELTGPGRWSLDMALGKSVEFMEGKRIDLRVDAQNVFNHPTPSNPGPFSTQAWNARFTQLYNPDFGLNGSSFTPFGYISSKGGHRTFQAKIRLSF